MRFVILVEIGVKMQQLHLNICDSAKNTLFSLNDFFIKKALNCKLPFCTFALHFGSKVVESFGKELNRGLKTAFKKTFKKTLQ